MNSSSAHGGVFRLGSGMLSLPLQASSATSQYRSCRRPSSVTLTASPRLLSASIIIILSMLNLPAGMSGRTLINLPARLCTCLASSISLLIASLTVATIRASLSGRSAHVHSSVSYSTPKTTPFLHGPKVLSWSSRGASFTPTCWATCIKHSSKCVIAAKSPLAAQASSRCWHTCSSGNTANRHTSSSTTFAASSNMPALDFAPKISASSLKYFPAH